MTHKNKTNRTSNRPDNRADIYTRITNQIITALERGIKPWTQPWNAAHAAGPVTRPLRHNGQPYSGINVLTLWASSMERHFAAPIWMTFKQARELGGHVRKGEKGSPVVYANTLTRTELDEATGEEIDQTIPFMKGYTVFNIEQIEGLPDHYYAPAKIHLNPDQRIAAADAFFADIAADRGFFHIRICLFGKDRDGGPLSARLSVLIRFSPRSQRSERRESGVSNSCPAAKSAIKTNINQRDRRLSAGCGAGVKNSLILSP